MEISKEIEAGQAIYSKPVLSIYDLWVLGISNQYIWKCPTSTLLKHFNQHVTPNHLDVGVGTGYFLDHCQFPPGKIRIGLLDLNQNSLHQTAKRIKRYEPTLYKYNALAKLDIDTAPYDSISLNYLFHCLPGSLLEKLTVLDNLSHLLSKNGTVFGATILSQGVKKSSIATRLMAIYNKKGVFNNDQDSYQDLKNYLSDKYVSHEITVKGCVAMFSASVNASVDV